MFGRKKAIYKVLIDIKTGWENLVRWKPGQKNLEIYSTLSNSWMKEREVNQNKDLFGEEDLVIKGDFYIKIGR